MIVRFSINHLGGHATWAHEKRLAFEAVTTCMMNPRGRERSHLPVTWALFESIFLLTLDFVCNLGGQFNLNVRLRGLKNLKLWRRKIVSAQWLFIIYFGWGRGPLLMWSTFFAFAPSSRLRGEACWWLECITHSWLTWRLFVFHVLEMYTIHTAWDDLYFLQMLSAEYGHWPAAFRGDHHPNLRCALRSGKPCYENRENPWGPCGLVVQRLSSFNWIQMVANAWQWPRLNSKNWDFQTFTGYDRG